MNEINQLRAEKEQMRLENEQMRTETENLTAENKKLNDHLNQLEQYSRKSNVIITGIPSGPNKNLYGKIKVIELKLEASIKDSDICSTHWLASKSNVLTATVKFNNYDRKKIL